MVRGIRRVERALGQTQKLRTASEQSNLIVARKSIVAACDIAAGSTFTHTNLTAKRPGTGLSPMLWDSVIGQHAIRDFQKDEEIHL